MSDHVSGLMNSYSQKRMLSYKTASVEKKPKKKKSMTVLNVESKVSALGLDDWLPSLLARPIRAEEGAMNASPA